jgi:hypothetical protein
VVKETEKFSLEKLSPSQAQWFTPVIPDTWEVEIGMTMI